MLPIQPVTMLVCVECGAQVTVIRVGESPRTQVMPCGHTAGYKSMPASEYVPQTAA